MSKLSCHASQRGNEADVFALNKAHVVPLNTKICPLFTANTKQGRPPLWRWPKAGSFVLAVNTGHILMLRRKTCALLRAETSALLRGKTCSVLRARTCALFKANTKETAEGAHRRPPPSVVAAEGRRLCFGSEESTCPSSQHSTCVLALNKAHVLRLTSQH